MTFPSRWGPLWASGPDSFGNFLSGAFAPVAFLWLVIAVVLQGSELQAQRRELALTRQTLALQARELANNVEQLRRQTEISAKAYELSRFTSTELAIDRQINDLCREVANNSRDCYVEFRSGEEPAAREFVLDRNKTVSALVAAEQYDDALNEVRISANLFVDIWVTTKPQHGAIGASFDYLITFNRDVENILEKCRLIPDSHVLSRVKSLKLRELGQVAWECHSSLEASVKSKIFR
ncbi:MAG: hypothetical protein HC869_17120 [Rhodospirillales bacterium]|nr:hypothetical protein [Rhodospirillales bacterium]